jgi:hypothetical protein
MNAPVVLREESRLDVHAAIIACRLFHIAIVAIERPAMEELFEPGALPVIEMDEVARQSLAVAAPIAFADIMLVQERSVVVVDSFGNDA